jgi:transglutaminase-like putative cysteine protease
MKDDNSSRNLDITVRVGCSLTYEVTGSASLLLNLKLAADPRRSVLFEALALGDDLPSEEFEDSHGNRVCRVTLQPGTNCFRHDAIVAVSSTPDNFGLVPGAPEAIGELPAPLLRYTLPSRYCDSDKLTNFAWDKFGHVEHGWSRVQAISRWIHQNIEYRYMSGRTDLSAGDVLQRGYGVCRDFAHLAVALNRTFNLKFPAESAHFSM